MASPCPVLHNIAYGFCPNHGPLQNLKLSSNVAERDPSIANRFLSIFQPDSNLRQSLGRYIVAVLERTPPALGKRGPPEPDGPLFFAPQLPPSGATLLLPGCPYMLPQYSGVESDAVDI
jgi:hypothetical protein